MTKRKYYVEVFDYGNINPEWNRHFEFDDFEKAFAYCKELDFHKKEYSLHAYNEEQE